MARPEATELPLATRSWGLLDLSGKFSGGWQRGVSFLDFSCLTPTVLGDCPSVTGLTSEQRPSFDTFTPVWLTNTVECSTLGSTDVAGASEIVARQTADYALALEMLTGAASARDHNAGSAFDPNPSLRGTATDLGNTHASIAKQVACLEQTIAAETAGRPAVLLVGYDWLTHAAAAQVIQHDGTNWRTPAGSLVVPGAGFDGRAPGAASPAPAPGAALYVYAVVAVWAETGPSNLIDFVKRSVNDHLARTDTLALVAFPTCAVFAAASTAATAC